MDVDGLDERSTRKGAPSSLALRITWDPAQASGAGASLHCLEHVRLESDTGVHSDDLAEGVLVGDPVPLLDEAEHGIVQVEEPVAVADVLELLLPDGELQLAKLRSADVLL